MALWNIHIPRTNKIPQPNLIYETMNKGTVTSGLSELWVGEGIAHGYVAVAPMLLLLRSQK